MDFPDADLGKKIGVTAEKWLQNGAWVGFGEPSRMGLVMGWVEVEPSWIFMDWEGPGADLGKEFGITAGKWIQNSSKMELGWGLESSPSV